MKIPAPKGNKGKTSSRKLNGALPEPSGAASGPAFLKAEHIKGSGQTKIQILGNLRESTGRFGDGIDIDVLIGKKQYSWTIKFESGNYRRLFEKFGKNEKKWKGTVNVERGEYLGNEYVKIV